ncbi:MAG: type II secretion system protein [Candidatus Gracilibacteria bacterium]
MNKKYTKIKAFTLIELMVTITIMVLVGGATYMNFAYSQNKMNLKLTAKDISQALYNARNMAINGLDSSSGNVSVGVYFDNSVDNKSKISFFSYPYDLDINSTDLLSTDSKKLIKKIDFYKYIELNGVENKDKFLFLFQAISGSGYYYYRDSTPGKKSFEGNSIDIKISLNQSESSNLTKDIKYIIGTNIIDY